MKDTSAYSELRQKALATTPQDAGIKLENNHQVYAALIDFGNKTRKVSLFCAIDGTVELYFSNAIPVYGLGRNENIKKAAISLLISSGQTLAKLPKNHMTWKKERLHLIAEGTWVVNINRKEDSKVLRFLDTLFQDLLRAIRENYSVDVLK